MTYQEANTLVDDFSFIYKGESISKEALIECRELIHTALEKQIPKRVIRPYKGNYKCPTCENYIYITDDDLYVYGIEPPKYCDECGQALDWSNEK